MRSSRRRSGSSASSVQAHTRHSRGAPFGALRFVSGASGADGARASCAFRLRPGRAPAAGPVAWPRPRPASLPGPLPRSRRPAQPRPSPGRAWSSRPCHHRPPVSSCPAVPWPRRFGRMRVFARPCAAKTSFWHGRLAQARHSEAMAERDLGFRFGILREDASRDAEWCQTVDFAAYRIRFSFGRDPAASGVTAAAIGFRRDVAFGSDRPAPNLARPGVTSRVARLGARRHPSALEVQHRGQNRATDALNGFAPIDGMTAEAKSNGGNRTVW